MPEVLKLILRWVLAIGMTLVGISHFTQPEGFVKIVPAYLPYPRQLVYLSGFFEVLGGVGLLIPGISHLAAWGLIALYVAVFPANVHMALHQIPLGDKPIAPWLLWFRLPLQLVLIAWAYLFTKR